MEGGHEKCPYGSQMEVSKDALMNVFYHIHGCHGQMHTVKLTLDSIYLKDHPSSEGSEDAREPPFARRCALRRDRRREYTVTIQGHDCGKA